MFKVIDALIFGTIGSRFLLYRSGITPTKYYLQATLNSLNEMGNWVCSHVDFQAILIVAKKGLIEGTVHHGHEYP